jgi:hypothetical protein
MIMKKAILRALIVLTTSFFMEVHATDFKDQRSNQRSWENLPIGSFLSFREWKEESSLQEQVPDYEKVIKERTHREKVGVIFQCVGSCRIDRGDGFFNVSPTTNIIEGDEIQTVGDSYLWIFLFDGTMVRLSPQSSITFNEFNIGVNENFINARVNAGNVVWLSRQKELFEVNNSRETDIIFFPYALYESLPITETKNYVEENLFELLTENDTNLNQYKNLNKRIASNNNWVKKPTYAFIVLPNVTLMGYSPNVEVVSLLGGKSYFKKRSLTTLGLVKNDEKSIDLKVQTRGFENKEETLAPEDTWIEVDEKGRSFSEATEIHALTMGEFITKRIPSIMVARELYMGKYAEPFFRQTYDPEMLAKNDGYLLWGKLISGEGEKKSNLELRLEFLKEYFRRIETSNLVTNARFRDRMSDRGEKISVAEYSNDFFITALNRYYKVGEGIKANSNDKSSGEVLNSTQKLLWKKMHGIR